MLFNKLLAKRQDSSRSSSSSSGMEGMKLMLHLLLPLCVHWIAEEITVSVLLDVITNALCPGESTCTQAIYLNGFKQTVGNKFCLICFLCFWVDDWTLLNLAPEKYRVNMSHFSW